MKSLTLYGMAYSPWTQRARWALETQQLAYRYVEYSPMLGELALRFRTRKSSSTQATVPLLVSDDVTIGDSFEIMRYAEEAGHGNTLFTDLRYAEYWRDKIERALEQIRIRVAMRVARDRVALKEAAARAVPAFLAGLATPVAAYGVRFFAKKYSFNLDDSSVDETAFRDTLMEARKALSDGRSFIEGEFGGVDMMLATLLQAVSPPKAKFADLGPATRKAWHHEALAQEFADLLAWRDALFETHR